MSEGKVESQNLLHIYGQEFWHDNVVIVGDRAALTALRAAIDTALRGDMVSQFAGKAETFVNDGEGYAVTVMLSPIADERGWQKLAVPYTAKEAREKRKEAIWPTVLVEKGK